MKLRWFSSLAIALVGVFPLATTAQTPSVAGIAHVAYRVADLETEKTFLAKLGYEQSFAFTTPEGKVSEIFVKINDRTFLEFYPQRKADEPLGWLHVCYESADMAAYVEAIKARGLSPSPVHKAGAGNLITAFKDPDGRNTEFTQYMPGSKHMLDQGLHILPNRIAPTIEGVQFGVPDMAASRKFYEAMGMTVSNHEGGLRARITAQPVPWIQLAPVGSQPKLVLRVSNLKAAEAQLKAARLSIQKGKKSLSVTDPGGNLFVFVEGES